MHAYIYIYIYICKDTILLLLFLQVPDELEDYSYNVTVSGSSGSVNFYNSTKVKLSKKVYSVFIQTDRAMYKPSQTSKYYESVQYINKTNRFVCLIQVCLNTVFGFVFNFVNLQFTKKLLSNRIMRSTDQKSKYAF